MSKSVIPEGFRRLNVNVREATFDALAAEARINVRKTGPHVAKILDDYIARKIANAERRQQRKNLPITQDP